MGQDASFSSGWLNAGIWAAVVLLLSHICLVHAGTERPGEETRQPDVGVQAVPRQAGSLPEGAEGAPHVIRVEPDKSVPDHEVIIKLDSGPQFVRSVSKVTLNFAELRRGDRGFGTGVANVESGTRIRFQVPRFAACGVYEVIVSTLLARGGRLSFSQGRTTFEVVEPCTPPPQVDVVSPEKPFSGSDLTIEGSNFGSNPNVVFVSTRWGPAPPPQVLPIISRSATQLRVRLPTTEPWSDIGCSYYSLLYIRNPDVKPASTGAPFYFSCYPYSMNALSYNIRMLPHFVWDVLSAGALIPDGQPGHVGLNDLDASCRGIPDPPVRAACLKERQFERANAIPRHPDMKNHDVIAFQEAFSDSDRNLIVSELAKVGYRFHSRILGSDRFVEQDGGVIILSRWPIQCVAQRLFGDACSDEDCLADKGVLHAVINKEGQRYNFFVTHLNNGDMNVQRDQLEIIKHFIDELRIPPTEPVIVAGDFNINFNSNQRNNPFYFEMTRELDVEHPRGPNGQYPAATAGGSYLDYVFYSKAHRKPVLASNRVLMPRDSKGDLSDHYAVEGSFVLQLKTTTLVPRPKPKKPVRP